MTSSEAKRFDICFWLHRLVVVDGHKDCISTIERLMAGRGTPSEALDSWQEIVIHLARCAAREQRADAQSTAINALLKDLDQLGKTIS